MHAQKLRDGRWAARYKTPDGRHHRTSAHLTAADALAVAASAEGQEQTAYAFCEGDADDRYWVGRYLTPDGWRETEHGFPNRADAVAEARELEQAVRAAAAPEA